MRDDLVVGVDVGGTHIKAALLDRELRPLRTKVFPTPHDGEDPAGAVIDAVADVFAELSAGESTVAALGAAVPGIVDEKAGIARYAKNLGWSDVPLRARLIERLPVPVGFTHDVRAGGLAEHRVGAAQGFSDVTFIAIGTGVAAAMVLDGHLHIAGGYAGEIGHVRVSGGIDCPCGAFGCLETITSCPGVVREYRARTGRSAKCEEVISLAHAGDPDADAVIARAVDALAEAISVLISLSAPEAIVLGGGMFIDGAPLLDRLDAELGSRLSFHRRPQLRLAKLGAEAGCIGAGITAFEAAR